MAFFFLQISLFTALSDTWMSIFSYFSSQTTEVRPKSANDEHPRYFCMGKQIAICSTWFFVRSMITIFWEYWHCFTLFRLRWMTCFMVRSNGVLTFVYFYKLGETAWTSTLYFLTFIEVARFEINFETLLFACANVFFINWLRHKSSLGLRTVSWCVKTKADHSW